MQTYIIPSFHYDVAYLKSYGEYRERSLDIIDKALGILERNASYRFTIEQVILLKQFWERYPGRRKLLRRMVRENRLAVAPGMFVMPDMNHPDGESMFMQAKQGREWLAAKLDYASDVCWIADCWGHHGQLPQILTQCGYRYYVFWRCMRREIRENDFRWRGIDGSIINTHWLARGYSGVSFPDETETLNRLDLDLVEAGIEAFRTARAQIAEFGDADKVLVCNGGDFRYPQESGVKIVEEWNRTDPSLNIRIATPVDYLDSVEWGRRNEYGGEFNSAFQGSFTSNIWIKQTVRKLVNRLLAVEALAVRSGTDFDSGPLWEQLLKQQFHDIICGTVCDTALEDCRVELSAAEEAISAARASLESDNAEPGWFNPLGFSRMETVSNGKRFFRVECAPYGFVTADSFPEIAEQAPPQLPCRFEGEHYTAEIDAQGYITSLRTDGNGPELIAQDSAPFGVLAMQMDYGDVWLNFEGPIAGGSVESSLTQNRPDPLERESLSSLADRRTFYPAVSEASVVSYYGDRLRIRQKGMLNFWRIAVPFETEITLDRFSPRIEYVTEFVPAGRHYRIRAAFPSAVADGVRRDEIPFGFCEREAGEHVAQTWIDYGTEAAGLSLFNRGIPGNNVDAGILLLTLFRSADFDYKTRSELSFNIGRPQRFEYAIAPRAALDIPAVTRQAHAFNRPLEFGCFEKTGIGEFLGTGADNLFISGLRPAREGTIFLRLYEGAGKSAVSVLTLPKNITEWCDANGLQQPCGEWTACSGRIQVTLKPFEIRHLLLRKKHD